MEKIRIGNDIRLRFVLDELSEFDQTSIKQLRCYVIKTGDVSYVNLDKFGYPQYYSPTEYDICSTNAFRYNWLPYNGEVYNMGMFGPIDDYRIFPTYNGFGVRSKQFKIIPKEYLAPSKVLPEKNAIELYFPAQDQRNLGEYKVVIVVTVYQPGWGSNNLRTFTIDKGVLFELVDEPTVHKNKFNVRLLFPEGMNLYHQSYIQNYVNGQVVEFDTAPIKITLKLDKNIAGLNNYIQVLSVINEDNYSNIMYDVKYLNDAELVVDVNDSPTIAIINIIDPVPNITVNIRFE